MRVLVRPGGLEEAGSDEHHGENHDHLGTLHLRDCTAGSGGARLRPSYALGGKADCVVCIDLLRMSRRRQ